MSAVAYTVTKLVLAMFYYCSSTESNIEHIASLGARVFVKHARSHKISLRA